jgi:hypothetical protein
MPKQFYIRATGSTCYDQTGITFPIKDPVDWYSLFAGLKDPSPRWENEFGWENQPEVLVFRATPEEVALVDQRMDALPSIRLRTVIMWRDWRRKPLRRVFHCGGRC